MSIRREGSVIHLEGHCPVEDAETLTALLESEGGWTVELSQCRQVHTALVQALIRFRPAMRGAPDDAFLREMIIPALRAADA